VITEHVMPTELCPACRHVLDRISNAGPDREPPAPGDWTWCIYCVTLLTFDDNLRVRLVTGEEEKAAMEHRTVRKAMWAIYRARRDLERRRDEA
jgi:hypothetical protein